MFFFNNNVTVKKLISSKLIFRIYTKVFVGCGWSVLQETNFQFHMLQTK